MTHETINRPSPSQSDRTRPLKRDETTNLIASNKVEGTKIYSIQGEKLGEVDHMMIGKLSGRVEYVVMASGGLLGMGEKRYPLPWDVLDYHTDKGGYVINIDKEQLKNGPAFEKNEQPVYDRAFGEKIYAHYGAIY